MTGGTTATYIGIAAATISAAAGTVGAIQQGKAASKAADFNAQVARNNETIANNNADYAIKAGEQKAALESLKGRVAMGKLKSKQAASGVDIGTGSYVDVQTGEREENVLDTATVLHNSQLEAYGYRSKATDFGAQADLKDAESENDETAGYLNSAGTLASGASSVADKWTKLNPPASKTTTTGVP